MEEKIKIGNSEVSISKELIEKAFGVKITDGEYQTFSSICRQHSLNPYAREIYFLKGTGEDSKATILIGKDGYFRMADSNPDYDGIEDGVIVVDSKGNQIDLEGTYFPEGSKLVGGWAKVYSKTKSHPKVARVALRDYVQTYYDRETKERKVKGLWSSMPSIMINKVAKTTALREAFPKMYNGTYGEEEYEKAAADIGYTPYNKNGEVVEEVKVNVPTLEEALKFKFDMPKIKGKTLQDFVDATKLDPTPLMETIIKTNGPGAAETAVVLQAVKDGKIKLKFNNKKEEGKEQK